MRKLKRPLVAGCSPVLAPPTPWQQMAHFSDLIGFNQLFDAIKTEADLCSGLPISPPPGSAPPWFQFIANLYLALEWTGQIFEVEGHCGLAYCDIPTSTFFTIFI